MTAPTHISEHEVTVIHLIPHIDQVKKFTQLHNNECYLELTFQVNEE